MWPLQCGKGKRREGGGEGRREREERGGEEGEMKERREGMNNLPSLQIMM